MTLAEFYEEPSAARTFKKAGLSQIELSPMNTVVQQALPAAWQKFCSLGVAKPEASSDIGFSEGNGRFALGRDFKNGKHQRLIIGCPGHHTLITGNRRSV